MFNSFSVNKVTIRMWIWLNMQTTWLCPKTDWFLPCLFHSVVADSHLIPAGSRGLGICRFCWTIAQSSDSGFKSGLLPDHISFLQMSDKFDSNHCFVLGNWWVSALFCMKMNVDFKFVAIMCRSWTEPLDVDLLIVVIHVIVWQLSLSQERYSLWSSPSYWWNVVV